MNAQTAKTRPSAGFCKMQRQSLAVCTPRSPQLAGHEVIRRPRSTNQDFAVFELACGAGIAVLVAFYRFFIDQMGNVD